MGVWVAGFVGWFVGMMMGVFIMCLVAVNNLHDPNVREVKENEIESDSDTEKESGSDGEGSQDNR